MSVIFFKCHPRKCLSATEHYSVHIRNREGPILYSYPHTIRSDSESGKYMDTNMVPLLFDRICSVFTPKRNTTADQELHGFLRDEEVVEDKPLE